MLDALIIGLNSNSLKGLNELQQLFTYLYEHLWMGFFFMAQMVALRFIKNSVDNINMLWSLNLSSGRKVADVSKAVFASHNMNLFDYWF